MPGRERSLKWHSRLYGTIVYWMDRFLIDCEARVKVGKLAQRTLDDYRGAIEIKPRKDGADSKSGALRRYFAPPMTRSMSRPTTSTSSCRSAPRPDATPRPTARRRASRRSCRG